MLHKRHKGIGSLTVEINDTLSFSSASYMATISSASISVVHSNSFHMSDPNHQPKPRRHRREYRIWQATYSLSVRFTRLNWPEVELTKCCKWKGCKNRGSSSITSVTLNSWLVGEHNKRSFSCTVGSHALARLENSAKSFDLWQQQMCRLLVCCQRYISRLL